MIKEILSAIKRKLMVIPGQMSLLWGPKLAIQPSAKRDFFRQIESQFWTHRSHFLANGSGFWASKSQLCALGVEFGPLSVNWEHVGVEFLELWKLILGL